MKHRLAVEGRAIEIEYLGEKMFSLRLVEVGRSYLTPKLDVILSDISGKIMAGYTLEVGSVRFEGAVESRHVFLNGEFWLRIDVGEMRRFWQEVVRREGIR